MRAQGYEGAGARALGRKVGKRGRRRWGAVRRARRRTLARAQASGAGGASERRWGARQQVYGRAEHAWQQEYGRSERARHRPGRSCARLGVLSWARLGVL